MISKPSRRRVDGILLLDKPAGLSSNQALQRVKKLYGARKAGHTGSLDPLATGLLPICFGEATKISGFLLDADKRYRVLCRAGETTSTGDAEGEVLQRRDVKGLDRERVENAAGRFLGAIDQVPPMYSAVKHQGERLYKLARKGVEVERKPRRITIHSIDVLDVGGNEFGLEVHCSKGTYIRTLVEDLGEALGVGAHVIGLRRLELGPFRAPRMYTAEELKGTAEKGWAALDDFLLPVESGLAQWPDVRLADEAARFIQHGNPVFVPRLPRDGWVRLFDERDGFLGMGRVMDDGRVAPKRLIRPGN